MKLGARFAVLPLLAVAWALPLEAIMGGDFAAHMLRHMILVALLPPVLVVAFPAATRVAPPVLAATVFEFVVVWAWHLPALHGLAYTAPLAFGVEQALFLGAGWAVWAGALRQDSDPLTGAAGLFLTSMHMSMLGMLLTLAPVDLYSEICGRMPFLHGQQAGALVMLGIGMPVYLVGGLRLAARALAGPVSKGLEP